MPYVQVRTNRRLPRENELAVKERLGKAIELLGKTEQWLMVEFVPMCEMYMGGDNGKEIAYVNVKLLGKASNEAYNSFTKEVTDMLIENSNHLKATDVYISYDEYERWGWNGSNL